MDETEALRCECLGNRVNVGAEGLRRMSSEDGTTRFRPAGAEENGSCHIRGQVDAISCCSPGPGRQIGRAMLPVLEVVSSAV
jgi:hypothetical protein